MGAQLLFDRLIVQSDDQGRQQADPSIIKAVCFPYFEEATPKRITAWLKELERADMARLYRVGKAALVQLTGWWKFQSGMRRAYPSRWPAPDGWDDRVFGLSKAEQDDASGNSPADRGQSAGNLPHSAPDFPPHARGSSASASASAVNHAGAVAGGAPAVEDIPDDDLTTLQKLAEQLTGVLYGFPRHAGFGPQVAALLRKHGVAAIQREWQRIAADERGMPTVKQLVFGADDALNRVPKPGPAESASDREDRELAELRAEAQRRMATAGATAR
jgi:hypothetical protein